MEKNVYLNSKEAKIEITDEIIEKDGMYNLANFTGENEEAVMEQAKTYCIGFMVGKDIGLKGFDLKNDINEFMIE